MESVINQIEKAIKKKGRGQMFFARDFASIGNGEAIKKALQRLQNSGLLMRVAHGIYYYPTINRIKYIKDKYLMPTVEEIAYAIAKRDNIRIIPTASYALNALGLSTQVPMNIVFITDGAPRRIAVGTRKGILFKHTSEVRNFAYRSRLLLLIVLALREIGQGNATPEQLEIIKSHLANVPEKELKTDIQLMPLWVRKTLLSL